MWVRFLLLLLAVTRYNKFNKFNNKPIINFLKHSKIEKSSNEKHKKLPNFLMKLNKKTFKFFFFKYNPKSKLIINEKSCYNLTLKHFTNVLLTLINDKFFFYSKTLLTFNNVKPLLYINSFKKLYPSLFLNLHFFTFLNLTSFSVLSFFNNVNQDLLTFYFFYINNFNYMSKTFSFYKSNFTKKKYSRAFNFSNLRYNQKKPSISLNTYSSLKKILNLKFTMVNKINSFWENYLLYKTSKDASFFKKSNKPQVIKYFYYSSFFFKTFSKNKKFFNIFKLKPFDIVNEHFILLTRESTELGFNNYFFFKNNSFNSYLLSPLLSFSTLFYQNDSLFENTFFKTKLNFNYQKPLNQSSTLTLTNLTSLFCKNYFSNKPFLKLKKKLKKKLKQLSYKNNNAIKFSTVYERNFKKPVLNHKSPYFFSSFEFFPVILNNPVFLKYSLFVKKNNTSFNYLTNPSFNYFNFNLKKNYFYSENNTFFLNNIIPDLNFTYIFKK